MIIVLCGIIKNDNKILIAKRNIDKSFGGLWEFPGGKLEEGETLEACLQRELKEELNINTIVRDYMMTSVYNNITLIAFKVDYMDLFFKLNSHSEIAWVSIKDLYKYDFAPADVPIVNIMRGSI